MGARLLRLLAMLGQRSARRPNAEVAALLLPVRAPARSSGLKDILLRRGTGA